MDRLFSMLHNGVKSGCHTGHSSWSLVVLSVHLWYLDRHCVWNITLGLMTVFAIVKLRTKTTHSHFSEILIVCDIGRKMGCEILTCQMQYEPRHKKTCFLPYANNNGADQPAHPRSLISAFVVRCLDSIIPLVSISAISNLCLASVAAQAGLSLPWSQIPKTGFLVTRLIWCSGQEHEQK